MSTDSKSNKDSKKSESVNKSESKSDKYDYIGNELVERIELSKFYNDKNIWYIEWLKNKVLGYVNKYLDNKKISLNDLNNLIQSVYRNLFIKIDEHEYINKRTIEFILLFKMYLDQREIYKIILDNGQENLSTDELIVIEEIRKEYENLINIKSKISVTSNKYKRLINSNEDWKFEKYIHLIIKNIDREMKVYNYIRMNRKKLSKETDVSVINERKIINDFFESFSISETMLNQFTLENIESITDLFNKWSSEHDERSKSEGILYSIDSIFMKGISDILKTNIDASVYNKQILIEEYIMNYEENYVNNIIGGGKKDFEKSILNFKLKLEEFHKLWMKEMKKYYINNFKELNKIVTVDKYKMKGIIIMVLMDDVTCFNIALNETLNLLLQKQEGLRKNELAMIIGNKISKLFKRSNEFKYINKKVDGSDKKYRNEIWKKIKDENDLNVWIDEETKGYIGLFISDLLEEIKDLLNVTQEREGVKTYNIINLHNNIDYNLIKKMVTIEFLPMVTKPKLWTKDKIGGYITNDMRVHSSPDESIVKSNPIVMYRSSPSMKQINCINYLNSVPFVINKTVLEYLLNRWENEIEGPIFKGLNKKHKDMSKFNELKKNSLLYKEIVSHNSQSDNLYNSLMIASVYKDEIFYLPTYLDFRGRVYCMTNYLSYQGGDLARSLLYFYQKSESKYGVINNNIDENISLYLANSYKLSKSTKKEKLKWARRYIMQLVKIIKEVNEKQRENKAYKDDGELYMEIINYSEIQEYINNSDEGFQFISTTLEILKILSGEKKSLESGLPILFDASCSGIQHLSSLAMDMTIAKMVNVVNDQGKKNDIYGIAANYITQSIIDFKNGKRNIECKETNNILSKLEKLDPITIDKFLNININRKIMKTPIMTIPYNVGLDKMSTELLEKLKGQLYEFESFYKTKLINNELETKDIVSRTLEIDVNKSHVREGDVKSKKKYIIKIDAEWSNNNKDIILTPSEWGSFCHIIYMSLYEIAPSLREIRNYLNGMMSLFYTVNKPVMWITPSGMKIKYSMSEVISKQISTRIGQKSRKILVNIVNKNKIDKNKSVIGLMPNFIHSLDASNVHEVPYYIENILSKTIIKDIDYYKEHNDSLIPKDIRYKEDKYSLIYKEMMDINDGFTKWSKDDVLKTINKELKITDIKKTDKHNRLYYNYDLEEYFEEIGTNLITLNHSDLYPLYTIHDCFATTTSRMNDLKGIVNTIFASMYFDKPYLLDLHNSLLIQLSSYTQIYTVESIDIIDEYKHNNNYNKLMKNLIKVEYISKIESWKPLFIIIDNNIKLIPQFPTKIDENIKTYQNIFKKEVLKSEYLIS